MCYLGAVGESGRTSITNQLLTLQQFCLCVYSRGFTLYTLYYNSMSNVFGFKHVSLLLVCVRGVLPVSSSWLWSQWAPGWLGNDAATVGLQLPSCTWSTDQWGEEWWLCVFVCLVFDLTLFVSTLTESHLNSSEVKPKHLDRPLVSSCSIGHMVTPLHVSR